MPSSRDLPNSAIEPKGTCCTREIPMVCGQHVRPGAAKTVATVYCPGELALRDVATQCWQEFG